MGLGVNFFGHNPLFIKKALEEQLELGIQLGPQSEFAGEVAELICELTKMERVTFSSQLQSQVTNEREHPSLVSMKQNIKINCLFGQEV